LGLLLEVRGLLEDCGFWDSLEYGGTDSDEIGSAFNRHLKIVTHAHAEGVEGGSVEA
jgi:hypothetical protein